MLLGSGGSESGTDPVTERLLRLLRRRRKSKGWTVRDLAEAAGISPSYVSLIENGHKSPDPAITERIGRALGLDRELLAALVRLQERPSDPNETIDVAARLLKRLDEVEAADGVEVEHLDFPLGASLMTLDAMSAPQVMSRSPVVGRVASPTPEYEPLNPARYVIPIPMIEEGTEPLDGGRERRPIWLDRRALPEREELEGAYAWRLTSRGLDRVRGVYRRGDIVIISPLAWTPEGLNPRMVFAVRTDGEVVLSRVGWTGSQLVLQSSGSGSPLVLSASGDAGLRKRIAGRVIVAVQRFR
jgi:transcriptional regulator with XRE-family HTH domain